MKYWWNK